MKLLKLKHDEQLSNVAFKFNLRRYTMSAGVVSGLRRSIPSKNGTTIRNAIQTDAKIPETAAGGALAGPSFCNLHRRLQARRFGHSPSMGYVDMVV
jgi:hypothetical protein